MKKSSLLVFILATVALFCQPVFADDVHPNEKDAPAAQEGTAASGKGMDDHESMMQESIKKMRAQMATIHQVKDPKKRLKLLQEHSKSMRDSLKMMSDMAMESGGMMDGCMMGGGMKGGCMMGGGMKDGCMMGGGMMGGNIANQSGDKANAAPAAQANPDKMTATDKASTTQGAKLWVCPMHPNVVRDQPGTCPICGMDLVEMDQSGASQSGHNHTMGGCMMGGGMMGGAMKGGCMMGGGMKDGCMMGGGMKGGGMMGMAGKHMDMMLMLMEQMIEHNEAAMAVRK